MYSVFEDPIVQAIDEAIQAKADAEKPRGHMGMSGIAGDPRTTWLQFRWSLPDDITPRTRRIFAMGDTIEDIVVRLLKAAGFTVHADDGTSQFGFTALGGHYAGSMDGAIVGLPQSKAWHVLEVKSVNGKRFRKLVEDGVEKWSPVYFGQMQCYGFHSGMTRALFAAYNKDTSELYFERVKIDPMYGAAMLERARDLITGPIPASSYPDRTWYEIAKFKSEEYQAVYWGDHLPPNPNCRNCRFSIADARDEVDGAAWGCLKKQKELSLEDQVAGCESHNWIPDLVALEVDNVKDDGVVYENADGVLMQNGPDGYSSSEFVALSHIDYKLAPTDAEFVNQVRDKFGAEITELSNEIEDPPF